MIRKTIYAIAAFTILSATGGGVWLAFTEIPGRYWATVQATKHVKELGWTIKETVRTRESSRGGWYTLFVLDVDGAEKTGMVFVRDVGGEPEIWAVGPSDSFIWGHGDIGRAIAARRGR